MQNVLKAFGGLDVLGLGYARLNVINTFIISRYQSMRLKWVVVRTIYYVLGNVRSTDADAVTNADVTSFQKFVHSSDTVS